MKSIQELEIIATATSVVNEYDIESKERAHSIVQELVPFFTQDVAHTIEGYRTWCRGYLETQGYMPLYSKY